MPPQNSHRRIGDDTSVANCAELAGKIGDDTCEKVLYEVCRANQLGEPITIWDLPRVTGLALHAAFAAVRTLEFGRILMIADNLSDPLGATLHVREAGTSHLESRRVA